ncbi:MAG: inner-rane translocator [Actinomycetia bacterium]|nr:inner-rane translocator [Actinomycetes bacterium]
MARTARYGPSATYAPPSMPDPGDLGWPPRDRVVGNVLWELLLAGAVAVVYVLASRGHPGQFGTADLAPLAMQGAVVGFVAVGLSLSIRAAVPNLAVGAIASGAGVLLTRLSIQENWGYGPAIAVSVGAAMAAGLALWLVIAILNVPAWAASLGASVLIAGALYGIADGSARLVGRYIPEPWPWFAAFAVASILGGVVWLWPNVRRALSGFRSDEDPAIRPRGSFGALIALVLSSGLAGLGGVLAALQLGTASPVAFDSQWLLALGAVLLGGVSAFGRRAGVFGTVLGIVLLLLVQRWLLLDQHGAGAFTMVVGAAILVGMVATRFTESAGNRSGY